MDLDRRDGAVGDHYDPFYKVSKLDIELQAQMNIMNKHNTLANKMWTPEYQQQIDEMKRQGLPVPPEPEADPQIPDNIRYYRPDAMGFTQAEQ
jgi:hypothetical protein